MDVIGDQNSSSARKALEHEMLATLPSLKGFALSLCGNPTNAEDLAQTAIVRGLAKLNLFEPGTNMRAWLFTILRNSYYSEFRKHRWEVQDTDGVHAARLAANEGENEAEEAFDLKRTLLFMACLPPHLSDILIAIGYLGMSYEESARRFGCEIGTVKSRLNRAREQLLQMMNKAVIRTVDVEKLKTATHRVPPDHPYYPIAKAYEELYADCRSILPDTDKKSAAKKEPPVSGLEDAWEKLVASGALEEESDELAALMQSDE